MTIKEFPPEIKCLVPLKRGHEHEIVFDAHGRRFRCCRLATDTWFLECPLVTPRTRFGNKLEIMSDIAHCLETGILPGKAGRP